MMRKFSGNRMNIRAVIRLPHGKLPPSTTDIVSNGEPVASDVITNIWISTEARKKYLIRFLFIFNSNLKQ